MPLVKVWNDNVHPFEQEFKGDKKRIEAGGFIEMEYYEAVEFQGLYFPMAFDGDNRQLPTSYKKIRVEQPKAPVVSSSDISLVNHATGEKAATKAELAAMLAEFAHLRVTDKDAELAAPKADKVAELSQQVAELTALVTALSQQDPKKGPGRPRKEG